VTLRRLLPFVVVIIVVAACSPAADRVAATVNGSDILVSDVLGLRETYGDDAVLAADFRDDLSRLIFQEVVTQGLDDDYSFAVDPNAVQARIDEFNEAIAANGVTRQDALQIPGATEEMLYREALAFELRTAGVAQIVAAPDSIESLLADPEAITEVCVRHILVETRGEAEDVAARLAAGEDFATVASEVSIDTAPGGDLGCAAASRYVPEFADASVVAPLGEVFGPVETEFGFHVLVVDDRTAPTAEDLAADPLAVIPQDVANSLWLEWFNRKVSEADVDIASEIGTWNATASGITPP
jgi:parvulin-like peptidyl-prolyl isomerase